MEFVTDPPISVKIQKMRERVRWQDPLIKQREIDQTRVVFADGWADSPEFSFLVIGDTGSGPHWGNNPQRRIAELMLTHQQDCRFILHTGDVIYMVGSNEYYLKNFIEPYREFLVGGDQPERIAYNKMVFNLPFLPVPGNHDYYDLPLVYGLIAQSTLPIRRLLRWQLGLDIGWHGSGKGKAYARAFLDYLKEFSDEVELIAHLDEHYTVRTHTGRCLHYQPGHFTRLPNRYYTFRYGGIDFFALDSNTFNAPQPLPETREGEEYRRLLEKRRDELQRQKTEIVETCGDLNPEQPAQTEQLDDLRTNLTQIDEVKIDIDKQLASDKTTVTDLEQLNWLRQKLIESWNTAEVRGRVLYFHHPPYISEATKWQQGQTVAVRHRLRLVLNAVAATLGPQTQDRPLVDLVLNGHAHCLDYLRTGDTGSADSHINWLVCGGSGFSLRRQRAEGPELEETFARLGGQETRKVARSLLYIGRNGHGSQKRRPYSCLRIDVQSGCPPKFIVRPFVAEQFQGQWSNYHIEPIVL